ncbi:hypothetical protein BAUCODRAFT_30754 [Baudoinia panamericana UAMH 10762]|uniref:Uncharacterized protein n=1 Tax=Baudoinia panamericana (strain UAMH 10762) TaxID=717646 RepID=M2NM75_BAUPA|nr:uncharacterized protein BAUCODRAFT_30754 [Baudoinia panamericana UAMH 10762]EMD00281.1 hypothetical protein BAUCODRAFT_30754 [Baudoinia panamericana UAMH 10762]
MLPLSPQSHSKCTEVAQTEDPRNVIYEIRYSKTAKATRVCIGQHSSKVRRCIKALYSFGKPCGADSNFVQQSDRAAQAHDVVG